jgi:hypothetical protein
MNAVRSVRGFTGGAYAGVIARYNENKDHYHDALCTVGGEDPRVKAVIADEKFHILDKRANKLYKPTKHFLSQLASKTKWGSFTLNKLYNSGNVKHQAILKDLVDISFQEDFGKEMLFRFNDQDDSCRAFLSDRYAVIDNNWVLDQTKQFLPQECGQAVACDKSGDDYINFSVVLPASLRSDDDSDYGGLIKIKNSEIGTHRLDISAGVFRTICSNGMIGWVRHDDVSVVHRGKVDLDILSRQIQSSIAKHIQSIPVMIEKLLGTKKMVFGEGASMTPLFASVAQTYKFSKAEIDAVQDGWSIERQETPFYAKTLFGMVNSLTRGSQKMGEASWEKLNEVGGALASYSESEFIGLRNKANALTTKDVHSILGKELMFA